jgi:hypothetical protein
MTPICGKKGYHETTLQTGMTNEIHVILCGQCVIFRFGAIQRVFMRHAITRK